MSTGKREALSIVLLGVCAILFLSIVSYDWRDIGLLQMPPNSPPSNFIGPVGAWLSFVLFMALGVGAYMVPLWFLAFGIVLIFRGVEHVRAKLVWAALFMLSLACLVDAQADWFLGPMKSLNICAPGGIPARLVMHGLSVHLLGGLGAGILMLSVMLASGVLFFGWEAIRRECGRLMNVLAGMRQGWHRADQDEAEVVKRKPAIQEWKRERIERVAARAEQEERAPKQKEFVVVPEEESPAGEEPAPKTATRATLTARPTPKAPPAPEPPEAVPEPPPKPVKPAPVARPAPVKPEPEPLPPVSLPAQGDYVLPPTSILGAVPPASERALRGDTDTTGRIIVQTLAEFGIDTQLKSFESGPVVTRYELVPAAGVKVERIANLSNNLALSLKATSVRVQAPIPGKGTVGIEVPNISTSAVYLREIVEGGVWQPSKFEVPIVIGKDVGGNDLVADLATMPHLLIAGATGSGKTVCMNTILAGLLMSRTPAQLQLMLIDPKIVEFSVYNNLPHLLGSRTEVITDPKRVVGGLRWAITEMENRYKIMAKAGVRNIKSYNQRPIEKQPDLFGAGGDEPASRLPERLPYIVIVVDELADLMLTAGAEIESYIARLAQLSRAVGIHMIIATQRPSVNVITGTIKANFPARIAFQVAQKNDSRIILDANGADKLLGRGDMLFLPPGSSKLIRAQGALTTDEDIRNIVDFIKRQVPAPAAKPGPAAGSPDAATKPAAAPVSRPAPAPAGGAGAPPASFDQMLATGGGGDDSDDELIEMSIQIIRETHRASTSSLQRRLRIGYTRAARVMDVLEERGIVGPARGSDPREILIDLDGEVPAAAAGGEDEQT
jgi:S-DNA-T family DNA segregation ATPase FtsK/SpoIIIE